MYIPMETQATIWVYSIMARTALYIIMITPGHSYVQQILEFLLHIVTLREAFQNIQLISKSEQYVLYYHTIYTSETTQSCMASSTVAESNVVECSQSPETKLSVITYRFCYCSVRAESVFFGMTCRGCSALCPPALSGYEKRATVKHTLTVTREG